MLETVRDGTAVLQQDWDFVLIRGDSRVKGVGRSRMAPLLLGAVLSVVGCVQQDLKPALRDLRDNIRVFREDYRKGRVKINEDPKENEAALKRRSDLFDESEALIAVGLGEKK